MFEKPIGMRDTFPNLYKQKETLRNTFTSIVSKWGYDFLETPALELYETVGSVSSIDDHQLFKLLDNQGNALVLRPDMTTPIARVAASKLLQNSIPIRLAYSGSVFRAQQREGGKPAEFGQMGAELIGDSTVQGDAETIALTVFALRELGIKSFQLSIGHVGFVEDFFKQILGNEERAEPLRRYLYERNFVGFRQYVKSLSLSSIDKERLLKFLQARGNEKGFSIAKQIVENGAGEQAIEELSELYDALKVYGIEDVVKLDLTLISHMDYYTGIHFEAYTEGVAYPIGSGGRYNQLLAAFGQNIGATGFGLRMDYCLEALGESTVSNDQTAIIYSQDYAKEAWTKAEALRAEGKRVVMQPVQGIQDMDAFVRDMNDVVFLLGQGERS
ncbi:ATP phosphoribosyltransferase regulatory subunit [Mangrovibacillus cuniculi]|uniref:ATP phosphoribosyltransferase regulatory subunit n=1 Tax=Mangrovibacillus cuniculi TaxID=2593652 RepID=A0A7S8HH96_9BACI|nr:ATP phosphoribosyltransferase regulatory subunit [Mangrovibacillus cuniculi]QPC48441.1 ATP phosphoribosyltransferase regulatory subunit [Mangrovibacillus cuniculi]